ncbi:2-aminomuconic semialdehyde dehydrogenase-like [Watersipora subatra]|uniref:2-aminomuconic semialdehyde dehydrogenase-like n=1 Tax=Watersipora subatra TaxID=2589382 RepID=UPI00355BD6B8
MSQHSEMLYVKNFVNNEFLDANSTLDSYDPSVGDVWAKIPDSRDVEVTQAYRAAKDAFPKWRSTPVAARSALMLKAADLLESKLEEFVVAESRDNGKPVWLSRAVDIPRAVYNIRFFATSILHHIDKSTQLPGIVSYSTRSPLGVAGIISPWNLPLYLLTWKIAPCIAAGNTCVCKPSELTSVTAFMFCEVLKEAGLPAGVVNMVFGVGPKVGEAIVTHPDIPIITFTGSTTTGQRIQRNSAEHCKKLSLELGGKNPGIIFADADLEKCISVVVRSCFTNQGEICLCTERLFVQRSIYDGFLEKFVAQTRKLKVGDPTEKSTTTGALISKEHLEKVQRYIKMAVETENGTVESGYTRDPLDLPEKLKHGYFVLPTIITGVADDSRVNQEEIFGPVVTVTPFDTEQEVIERANKVKYGLSANVWSSNVGTVHRVAQSLEAGTVWCNCWLVRDLRMPFGGYKLSGVGRESQEDSLDFFTEQKTVCIDISQ